MTPQDVKDHLTLRNITFDERPIQNAIQIRCHTGEIFTVYDSGKVVEGGTSSTVSKELMLLARAPKAQGNDMGSKTIPQSPTVSKPKDVFIVYGRDTDSRDQLELILRRMGMNPIILSRLPAAGDTLIEKLENYVGAKGRVAYACVLVTPDDEGYLAGAADQKKYRARQNVVMELGMVLARLGRKRVAVLIKNTVEHPSDIAGLIYIPFEEKVAEIANKLHQELITAGLQPSLP